MVKELAQRALEISGVGREVSFCWGKTHASCCGCPDETGGTCKAAKGRGHSLDQGSAEGEVAELGGGGMEGGTDPAIDSWQDLLIRTFHDGCQIDEQCGADSLILQPQPVQTHSQMHPLEARAAMITLRCWRITSQPQKASGAHLPIR